MSPHDDVQLRQLQVYNMHKDVMDNPLLLSISSLENGLSLSYS